MVRNNNHNSRSSSSSNSRSKSLSRRGSSGQSSLSAHIQQQMDRPRRKGRDPTPLSRSARNESAPGLNYGRPPPSQPSTISSPPPRRSSASMPRRTVNFNPTNNKASPSSSEERAAIAAHLAKNSFSAHQNLQKLIDEQQERESHRMEHAQTMQSRQQSQQMPDLELVQSIARIMAFHKRNSTPGTPGYDDNNAAQQQQQQRRSKSQLMMYEMDKYDSSHSSRSIHSNSTAPSTALSSSSESFSTSTSEPYNNSSSLKTPSNSKQPQLRRQNSSTPRYLGKETLHNHLQDAPRESRVQLTRLIESLQSENQRLNDVNLTQVNQIEKLESEMGGLLRELLRYRLEFGEITTAAEGGGSVGDASSEHVTVAPGQLRRRRTTVESMFDSNVKEEKRANTQGLSAISNQELLLTLQQQEQEECHQSPETRLRRSNSLESIFEPQSDRSSFVEQKGGTIISSGSGSVTGSVSVPSMTDTDGSCSWSYSTPKSDVNEK